MRLACLCYGWSRSGVLGSALDWSGKVGYGQVRWSVFCFGMLRLGVLR